LSTDPKLFPLGEGVGCLWQDNERRVFFATHDGKVWSRATPLGVKQVHGAASADAKTIYAVVGGGREGPMRILKGNGKSWGEDFRPAAAGHLTVQRGSGRLHYVYPENAEGKTRVMMISCDAGTWGKARAVAGAPQGSPEDSALIVSVPRLSPEEFVPAAVFALREKSDVVACQVIKVPAEAH
jgi:hypothetical protein